MQQAPRRGIWRHGQIKAFLTRTILRTVFQPLLYRSEDTIHYEAIMAFHPCLININEQIKPEYRGPLLRWLIRAPLDYFQQIFMDSEGEDGLFSHIPKLATAKHGKECACITQAFIICYLQQLLTNSPDFAAQSGLSLPVVEHHLRKLHPEGESVLQWLSWFRQKFDVTTLDVDPRDWPIWYVAKIAETLIANQESKTMIFDELNRGITKNTLLIAFTFQFIAEQMAETVRT